MNTRIMGVAAFSATILSLGLAVPASADSPSPVSPEAFTPIEQRYWDEPDLRELLGNPVDTEYLDNGISYQHFQNGWLYYTKTSGVHELHGDVAAKFDELGGHEVLGPPTTDESGTPDGVGRYNHFMGSDITLGEASIYWTPETGPQGVAGPVRDFWESKGWEVGYLSYPTSTTTGTSDGLGRFNHFTGSDGAGASVYWTGETGAHSVQGEIRNLWSTLGWEKGLGYPTTDELPTDANRGRYNDFTGNDTPPAAVYWTPQTGTHHLGGPIMQRWEELGRETGYLGYPTSDPYETTGETIVEFQGGIIGLNRDTGEVVDRP